MEIALGQVFFPESHGQCVLNVCVCTFVCMCAYIRMYVCVYIYIYIYIYIYDTRLEVLVPSFARLVCKHVYSYLCIYACPCMCVFMWY